MVHETRQVLVVAAILPYVFAHFDILMPVTLVLIFQLFFSLFVARVYDTDGYASQGLMNLSERGLDHVVLGVMVDLLIFHLFARPSLHNHELC